MCPKVGPSDGRQRRRWGRLWLIYVLVIGLLFFRVPFYYVVVLVANVIEVIVDVAIIITIIIIIIIIYC